MRVTRRAGFQPPQIPQEASNVKAASSECSRTRPESTNGVAQTSSRQQVWSHRCLAFETGTPKFLLSRGLCFPPWRRIQPPARPTRWPVIAQSDHKTPRTRPQLVQMQDVLDLDSIWNTPVQLRNNFCSPTNRFGIGLLSCVFGGGSELTCRRTLARRKVTSAARSAIGFGAWMSDDGNQPSLTAWDGRRTLDSGRRTEGGPREVPEARTAFRSFLLS